MKNSILEKLEAAKRSIAYVNWCLSHDLENWEVKEYEGVLADSIEEKTSAQLGLAYLSNY